MPVNIRPTTPADAQRCGAIVYEAFRGIAQSHGFPPDIPSVEMAAGFLEGFIRNPRIFGVLAESGGQIIGSNFLDERDPVRGVGPITVEPSHQGKGVGRRLMEAVLDRGRSAVSIRLVQDAFNTTSMSLYASLGFDAREPLALMSGTPQGHSSPGLDARPLSESDLDAAATLCREVHGFDRKNELQDAIGKFGPMGLFRDKTLAAYISSPTFWIFNHGVARSERDMLDLLAAAGAANSQPLSLLVPIRRAGLFRWCLGQGLRVCKPMTLMSIGEYHEPRGSFFPSVAY
ncbi:MAG: GNAT family N-acetyltransferase [Tepidisphaeraceae bacterium]